MKTLHLDSETFCATPISHGTYRYAEDVEIMLVPWAWGDDAPVCWDLTAGEATLADVQALVDEADEIVIQNSMFDRTVLAANGVVIPVEKIIDTMVQGLSHSLPGSLDKLCDILGVPTDKAKSKSGARLIHLFCKPLGANRKLDRATRLTHPAEWAEFKDYAAMDVVSMREVRRRLPAWNYPRADETELWRLDQRINDRGMLVDVELAQAALRAVDRAKAGLAKRAQSLSDGAVMAATQRAKVLEFLADAHGVKLEDLQGATVEKLLESDDLHPDVRDMLAIRLQAAATAPAKYKALLKGVSHDGRLRGTLQFCGAARTGRDAGRLFQPQNLPRPVLKSDDIELGIAALKGDVEDLLYDNVMELCGSAVRGAVIAPPGRKLVIADLSNIEGRTLAWLAGEMWKLEAFRAFDRGEGPDLYKVAYSNAFGLPIDLIEFNQRQIGKVMELMLGYEGGVGAFLTGAATYGFDIESMAQNAIGTLPPAAREDAEGMLDWRRQKGLTTYGLSDTAFIVCEAFKALWRKAHPATCQLWKDLQQAAINAVQAPKTTFRVGAVAFQRDGAWLRLRLPSGRYLCYPAPEVGKKCSACDGRGTWTEGGVMEDPSPPKTVVCQTCRGVGRLDSEKLSYEGVNQYTRRWERLGTYGGKIAENATQAAARDVLFHGVRLAEAAGYEIIMRVHDELICEVPDDPAFSAEGLSALMATNPPWADGLPLAAAGFSCTRYRKES